MGACRLALLGCLYGVGRTLERAATLVFYGAAGAVRLEELRRAIQREWRESGARESDTYVASGLMLWEEAFYPRFLKPDDRILVVGCGTGRDLLALLERGHQAEGLDVVAECTARARQMLAKRRLAAEVYTGAIETFPLPGRFDAFIFSWFCYSYIPQSATRIAVLRKLNAHLNPGGRVLISYVPAPPRRLPIWLARSVAWLVRSDWRPEIGDIFFPSSRKRPVAHYEHRFPPGKLEEEAEAAGLTVVFHERAEEATAVLSASVDREERTWGS